MILPHAVSLQNIQSGIEIEQMQLSLLHRDDILRGEDNILHMHARD
jgi:hypothetical protein